MKLDIGETALQGRELDAAAAVASGAYSGLRIPCSLVRKWR